MCTWVMTCQTQGLCLQEQSVQKEKSASIVNVRISVSSAFISVRCSATAEGYVTTGRTATVKPTGLLPSVTSLALEEAQTVVPSGKQITRA